MILEILGLLLILFFFTFPIWLNWNQMSKWNWKDWKEYFFDNHNIYHGYHDYHVKTSVVKSKLIKKCSKTQPYKLNEKQEIIYNFICDGKCMFDKIN